MRETETVTTTTPTGQPFIHSPIDPDGGKDGELIGLCREFQAQEDELNRIGDVLMDMPWKEREVHPLAQTERDGVDRINELRGLISDLPARTPEGLRAKALAALIDFGPEGEWPSDNSYWIVWTLARDVLGRDA